MINMALKLYSNDGLIKVLILAGLFCGLCASSHYFMASLIPAAVVIYFTVYAE